MFSLRLSQNLSWTLDLYYLKLISCVVLEKYSNLILIFFILIASLSLQCLLPVYIFGIRRNIPFSPPSSALIDLLSSTMPFSLLWGDTFPGVSICISNIDIDLFSGDLFSAVSPTHLSDWLVTRPCFEWFSSDHPPGCLLRSPVCHIITRCLSHFTLYDHLYLLPCAWTCHCFILPSD